MPLPCSIETCKRRSRALCYCCNKSLCLDHLKQHEELSSSEVNLLLDELNVVVDQLLKINVDDVINNCRQKLDKWRDDCHMTIDRFYQDKCEELRQRRIERADKKRNEIYEIRTKFNDLIREEEPTFENIPSLKATINNIKRDLNEFEKNGIIVDVRPLNINKDFIQIEEWSLNELSIQTLSSPFQKLDCTDKGLPVMSSSNRFLLLDQHPNICLYDRELTLVKQLPWEHDRITDLCWSSTLNSLITITERDGVFLIDEDMTLIEPIQTIETKQWLSCTCSDATLFITTNGWGSDIFEFHLLSSFNLIKQWNPPKSCENNERIDNIAYNKGTLIALMKRANEFISTVKIELLSSTTLDRLWSFPLDLTYNAGLRVYRVCLLRCDEWLIMDHQTSRLLHINKDGKLKFRRRYDPTPQNAVLFGSNILAIRTTNCVNFYKV